MLKHITCGIMLIAGTMAMAQSVTPQYKQAEMKKMIREAHAPAQYQTIATYFHTRQSSYQQLAQSEKQEWERRSQFVSGPAAKYPRPVDSSKYRYDYFTYEAGKMGEQAAHFDALAGAGGQVDSK